MRRERDKFTIIERVYVRDEKDSVLGFRASGIMLFFMCYLSYWESDNTDSYTYRLGIFRVW